MFGRMGRLVPLVLPLAVGAVWTVAVPTARGTGCTGWGDLLDTIDIVVQSPGARDPLTDCVEAIRDASNCTEYNDQLVNFGSLVQELRLVELLSEAEADAVAECWVNATNGVATCGVIAGQNHFDNKKCVSSTKSCSEEATHSCKETYKSSTQGGNVVTGCRNGQ